VSLVKKQKKLMKIIKHMRIKILEVLFVLNVEEKQNFHLNQQKIGVIIVNLVTGRLKLQNFQSYLIQIKINQ
jgi:hypothetical protein